MKYDKKEKAATVKVQDAVGRILLHDITRIVPDLFKGPAFKKGHVITSDDVKELLDLGKQHIYVACLNGEIHENDAALRIAAAACGSHIELTAPKEGKVGFKALKSGLLKINVKALAELNRIPDVICATLHTDRTVVQGEELAATRIIPLSIDENRIIEAEAVCQKYGSIIDIKPFKPARVGLIVTGSEVYNNRIRDGFGPVVQKKFEQLGSRIFSKQIVTDDIDMTVSAIRNAYENGAELIAVTGGMSVDPDDLTPASIKKAGGEVLFYGAPVLPGAMFMLAMMDSIPVIGLPGCVMYHRASIFDLIVPRLLTGEAVTQEDIIMLGHGGFCPSCRTCRFPSCSFGK